MSNNNLIGQIEQSVQLVGQIAQPLEIVAVVTNGAKGKDGLTVTVNGVTHVNGNIDIDSNDILIDKNNIDSLTIKESIEENKDKQYTHVQILASNHWVIDHPLNKFPSVTVIDSGGSLVVGDIAYVSNEQIIIDFTVEFSGMAHLN